MEDRHAMSARRLNAALCMLVAAPLAFGAPPPEGAAANGDSAAPAATASATAPSAPAPGAAPEFEGISWKLAAFRSGDTLAEPKEGRRPALFEFELGRMAGSPGCNRLLGGYTISGSTLRFEPKMAATMMACPDPLMAQDKAVGEAFAVVASFKQEGDLLELLDGAGKPVLRFVRLKPEPLVGPLWELESFNNGKQALVSALAGSQVSLELRADGTLGGSDGCNRFMSGYTLENGKLTIGPLATTRMACKGPQGAADQASGFAAAMERVAGYKVEGNALTLLDADGKVALRFRTASAKP
jgi:heat shock protein HslJ